MLTAAMPSAVVSGSCWLTPLFAVTNASRTRHPDGSDGSDAENEALMSGPRRFSTVTLAVAAAALVSGVNIAAPNTATISLLVAVTLDPHGRCGRRGPIPAPTHLTPRRADLLHLIHGVRDVLPIALPDLGVGRACEAGRTLRDPMAGRTRYRSSARPHTSAA